MQIEQKKSAIDLTELAVGIVILGIVVAIGATILTQVANAGATCPTAFPTFTASTQLCSNSSGSTTAPTNVAFNVSMAAATGLGTYGNWFTILVIVGVAAVILSLIFMAFGRSGGSSGMGVAY